jgi:hypothetical protein
LTAFSSVLLRLVWFPALCLPPIQPDNSGEVQISLDFTMGQRSIVTFRQVRQLVRCQVLLGGTLYPEPLGGTACPRALSRLCTGPTAVSVLLGKLTHCPQVQATPGCESASMPRGGCESVRTESSCRSTRAGRESVDSRFQRF